MESKEKYRVLYNNIYYQYSSGVETEEVKIEIDKIYLENFALFMEFYLKRLEEHSPKELDDFLEVMELKYKRAVSCKPDVENIFK